MTYLNSIFFTIFTQKSPFFVLKLSRSLFFWPEMSLFFFFFFLKIGQFLAFILNFLPNFLPKLSPSLFFLARKVLFSLQSVNCIFFVLNCSFFVHLTQIFPNFLFLKTPFFLFKLSPSLFLFGPKVFFSFLFGKLLNFLPLHFNFSPIFGPKNPSFLARQITPPTKNGHAPPPTESRKSYQSVNPSSVWAR